MEPAAVKSRIKRFLEQSFPNPSMTLTDQTSLLEGWFIDSLGIVQTVIFLEEAFACNVRPSDIKAANFQTVEALASYVLSQVNAE